MKITLVCYLLVAVLVTAVLGDEDCQSLSTVTYGKITSKSDMALSATRCYTLNGRLSLGGAFPMTAYVALETDYRSGITWDELEVGDYVTVAYVSLGGGGSKVIVTIQKS